MGSVGWRGVRLTGPRRKMLLAMAAQAGREWTVKELELAAGTAEATTYQSLRSFEEAGWTRSRRETYQEHQRRKREVGNVLGGPRLTFWSLTEAGQLEVNQL